jgi:signal transduction histidine kinase
VTEPVGPDTPAAASPRGEAAAASSRALLDAALSRAIAALAHDLRNALGVVSMQVEVIAVRAASATPDVAAIAGSAGVASDHIERLAAMTNALIAFARGRTSSDLAVIVTEVAALVPMRPLRVAVPQVVAVDVDPSLTRAVALEVLVLALASRAAPTLAVMPHPDGATLQVVTGSPLPADESMEWVVQFRRLGGRIESTEDGMRLQFPPIA